MKTCPKCGEFVAFGYYCLSSRDVCEWSEDMQMEDYHFLLAERDRLKIEVADLKQQLQWTLADHDKLTTENERLEADLKAWQDREVNIDEQLAAQRAVPSSELVNELNAAAVHAGVFGESRLSTILTNAAARIDALEQELADLRELRRLVEVFANAVEAEVYRAVSVLDTQYALLDRVRKMRGVKP